MFHPSSFVRDCPSVRALAVALAIACASSNDVHAQTAATRNVTAPRPCTPPSTPPQVDALNPLDLVRGTAGDPFARVIADPRVVALLRRPGTAQPLPLPLPSTLTTAQRQSLLALREDVAREWSRLVAGTRTELARRAEGSPLDRFYESEPTGAELRRLPPGDRAAIEQFWRLSPQHRRGARANALRIAQDNRARRAAFAQRPTAETVLARGGDTGAFRAAYLRYLGVLEASQGGATIAFTAGRVARIVRPDGTAVAPIYDGDALRAIRTTSPLGEVSYLRREPAAGAGGERWTVAPTLDGPGTPAWVGSIELHANGAIVRAWTAPAAGARAPREARREVVRVDGTGLVVDARSELTTRTDADGRVTSIGPTPEPAHALTLRYRGPDLVEIRDGRSGTLWTRAAPGTWRGVTTAGRTVTFEGEITLEGGTLVRTPRRPTARIEETMLRLEFVPDSPPRIRAWSADGDSQISGDRDYQAIARDVVSRRLRPHILRRENRDPLLTAFVLGPNDQIAAYLRAEGYGRVRLSTDSPYDPLRRTFVPWYLFERRDRVLERRIVRTDLRTGRTSTSVVRESAFAFLERRYRAGHLPGVSFAEFAEQHQRAQLTRYRILREEIIMMSRVLVGDTTTRRLYGHVPVRDAAGRTRDDQPGLLAQERVFAHPENGRRFRDRARMLAASVRANAPVILRRLALAESGRFAELDEDERRREPGVLTTRELIGAFQNLDALLLDIERDLPQSIRVFAAIRDGAARSVRNLALSIVTHPVETAGFVVLGVLAPEAAAAISAAMLLDHLAFQVAPNVQAGIALVQRGLDRGDNQAVLQGIALLSESATDLGVQAAFVVASHLATPRTPPARNLRQLSEADLYRVVARENPEIIRQLGGRPTRAQLERVLEAWERGGRHPLGLTSSAFHAELAEVRAAMAEIARRRGFPITSRVARTGVQVREGFILLPNDEPALIRATLDQLAQIDRRTYPIVVHGETGEIVFRAPGTGHVHRVPIRRLAEVIARDPALARSAQIYLGSCFGGLSTAEVASVAAEVARVTGRSVIAPRGREFVGRGADGRVYVQVVGESGTPLAPADAYVRVHPNGRTQPAALSDAFGERVSYVAGAAPAGVRMSARAPTRMPTATHDGTPLTARIDPATTELTRSGELRSSSDAGPSRRQSFNDLLHEAGIGRDANLRALIERTVSERRYLAGGGFGNEGGRVLPGRPTGGAARRRFEEYYIPGEFAAHPSDVNRSGWLRDARLIVDRETGEVFLWNHDSGTAAVRILM